ncbi:cytochrome c3 family protein [Calderihabitans maritimus]|uniref:Fibronectin type III domain-containing protein n=1 Tax=Calderihabitans maritimus TaxID=1246530 RepID=A0A1Z5HVM9_9FIRM|nr:cytochrome c3 family protein [Calderihabitans maritimus]GAW93582.1 fibronectin type III domain-containing protein [Calderihabitans maritimus]
MWKRALIALFISLLFLLSLSLWAEAAPQELRAIPKSENWVDLSWKGSSGETYKVWMSTDGSVWQNIYIGSNMFSYSVKNGILGYHNYYFVVTTSEVMNYPQDRTATNSSNEAVAYPPNQHAHAYYLDDTNLCSNCHKTHTALGPNLLRVETTNDSCLSCHDGTGSKYDILNGTVDMGPYGDPLASPAGPFGDVVMGVTTHVYSRHSIGAEVYNAPGGNPLGTGDEWQESLGCASCHDAHGSPNYRMLTVITPDNNNVSVRAYAYTDEAGGQERVNYVSGMSEFCMGCHRDLYAGSGSGSNPKTDAYTERYLGKYMHPVGVAPKYYERGELTTTLPLEGTSGDNRDKITCLTCHLAHGSQSATEDTGDTYNDGGDDLVNYLLRRDYRGVCQDCHKK